jgi:hypothetical protein
MRVLTTDVFAGAYLMTQGARLVDLLVDRTGARASGTFILEGNDVLELHEAYCRGDAVAPVKLIRDAVTELRSRLAGALQKNTPHRQPLARASNA